MIIIINNSNSNSISYTIHICVIICTLIHIILFFFLPLKCYHHLHTELPPARARPIFRMRWGVSEPLSWRFHATETSSETQRIICNNKNHQQKYQDSFPLPKKPSKSLFSKASWLNLHLECYFFIREIYLHLAKHLIATLFSKVAGDIPSFSSFSSSFDKLMILQVWQNPALRSSLWSRRRAPWESVRCVRTTALKEWFLTRMLVGKNVWVDHLPKIVKIFSEQRLDFLLNFPNLLCIFLGVSSIVPPSQHFTTTFPNFSQQPSWIFSRFHRPPKSIFKPSPPTKISPTSLIQDFFIKLHPWIATLRASPPNRSSRKDLLGRTFPPLNDPTSETALKLRRFGVVQ